MKRNWKNEIMWIVLPLAAGTISGLFSREASEIYGSVINKPLLSPPAIVFPIVWTVLYLLMGIGASLVSREETGREKSAALNMFMIQLVVNFFWSLFFFNAGAYGFSFLWLLLLLALASLMTVLFYRQNKIAGLIQIPYILWLIFAAYLNYGVWMLNR